MDNVSAQPPGSIGRGFVPPEHLPPGRVQGHLDRHGHRHDVGPGQALCIPRGSVHRFDNNGAHPAKVLCVVTPAAIGPEYFREAFAVLNAAAGGPPDRAKMMEIMHRHGLTPAPQA